MWDANRLKVNNNNNCACSYSYGYKRKTLTSPAASTLPPMVPGGSENKLDNSQDHDHDPDGGDDDDSDDDEKKVVPDGKFKGSSNSIKTQMTQLDIKKDNKACTVAMDGDAQSKDDIIVSIPKIELENNNINKFNNVNNNIKTGKIHAEKKTISKNMQLYKLCKKMVIITCTTCVTTIVSTLLTGWLINVSVTTTVDAAINGVCIMLSFAFLDEWFDLICCACQRCINKGVNY